MKYKFLTADGRLCCEGNEVAYLCPQCAARAKAEHRAPGQAQLRSAARASQVLRPRGAPDVRQVRAEHESRNAFSRWEHAWARERRAVEYAREMHRPHQPPPDPPGTRIPPAPDMAKYVKARRAGKTKEEAMTEARS